VTSCIVASSAIYIIVGSNLEILFGPLHRSPPFIEELRCQAIQTEHRSYSILYSRENPKRSLYCDISMMGVRTQYKYKMFTSDPSFSLSSPPLTANKGPLGLNYLTDLLPLYTVFTNNNIHHGKENPLALYHYQPLIALTRIQILILIL
jgi:hypothetical protein